MNVCPCWRSMSSASSSENRMLRMLFFCAIFPCLSPRIAGRPAHCNTSLPHRAADLRRSGPLAVLQFYSVHPSNQALDLICRSKPAIPGSRVPLSRSPRDTTVHLPAALLCVDPPNSLPYSPSFPPASGRDLRALDSSPNRLLVLRLCLCGFQSAILF